MQNFKTHKEIMSEMLNDDPEFRAAYEEETRKELLREVLAGWRKKENLTKAEVAARMGVKPPVVTRMENNITKVSIDTLTRYARACGITHPKISLY
ncbi:helix-turn-helix transcriptional regulator [Acerihabitans sp. TG2]|nr:helix-turn-helix transcriptional regulator [Acerihabitans sp. TG2]MEA9392491.1 helix-turn-helix transcriptional regulator [Acerihabitans sp. TG2]